MSSKITEAFVQQYNANVFHLSQQKGSRLQPAVRNESQKSKAAFWDRIGTVAATLKVGRHSNTPQSDTPHTRRMVTMNDYEWADLVDNQDKLRMLLDPTSEYAMAAAFAFGRTKDDVIIAAATGSAYGGESGGTAVVLPDTQKFAATTGSALSNLNVYTLRKIKKIFDAAEVEGKRYFAFTSSQAEALLGQTEVTSSDYNSVQALVQGEVNTFLGFEFIRTERLGTVAAGVTGTAATGAVVTSGGGGTSLTGDRSCFAFAEGGLLLSTGEDFVTKIDELPTKSYSTQVYARMSLGATRMEEEKVIEVICQES